MFFIIGSITVLACVLGGYMAMGGKLYVLFQPFELVIIGGAAIGAYLIANPMSVIKASGSAMGSLLKGARYKREHYIELLTLMYQIFRLARQKGMLALEQHVERPNESALFQQFPGFLSHHHAVEFMCDYLRLLTVGAENSHEVEALMDADLETLHSEESQVSGALQSMSDGLPALGIVAAVLGVIKTMGAISEPPEVLGKLIGGALVGTFLGVLLSYGFVGPMASFVKATSDAEHKYLICIRAGIIAYMQGYAPQIAVEFARKALLTHDRPSFAEVEVAVQSLPPPTA
jgi:chemotaxis protein MotA